MINIWLDAHQNKFKIWNNQSSAWVWIDSISEIASASFIKSSDKEICIYYPTQNIISLVNELSIAQIKQLGISGQQYLFEDISLSSVENLVVKYTSTGLQRYFYALGSAEIEQWQNSVSLAGYKLVALLPDFTLLPIPDVQVNKQIILCQLNGYDNKAKYLARLNEAQGVEVSHISFLPQVIENVEEIVFIKKLNVDDKHNNLSDNVTHQQNTSFSELKVEQNLNQLADEKGIVLTPASTNTAPFPSPTRHPLNFIQSKRGYSIAPHLKIASVIILLASIVQIAADGLQWYQYKNAAAETQEAIETQYSSWFSGESLNSRVNLEAQIKPHLLTKNSDEHQQITIMNQIAPLIKQSQLTAQSLRWNDSNIILLVKGNTRDSIDKLQQGLTVQGLTANLGSVSPSDEGNVIGEINIALNNAQN